MQDVHCIADVEWLSQPARGRGSRVQGKPVCLVACSEDRNGITHHGQRSWYFGQGFAVRAAKFQLAVRLSLDLESLFVEAVEGGVDLIVGEPTITELPAKLLTGVVAASQESQRHQTR